MLELIKDVSMDEQLLNTFLEYRLERKAVHSGITDFFL